MLLFCVLPSAGMVKAEGAVWPKLKAKAAETAAFMLPLLNVWKAHYDRTKQEHRMILKLLERVQDMERTIQANANTHKFPYPVAEHFLKLGSESVGLVSWLYNFYIDKVHEYGGLFGMTYKSHELLHGCAQARWINPTMAWTYQGEDLVGQAKYVLAKSTHGSSKVTVGPKALRRYWRGMACCLAENY